MLAQSGVPDRSVRTAAHPPAAQTFASLPIGLQTAASATLGATNRHFDVVRRSGRLLVAAGGGLSTQFTSTGPRISAGGATLGLTLTGARAPRARSGAPAATGNTVAYSHPALVEWYRNGPLGLEQGFTVAARPEPSRGGWLSLRERISGGFEARSSATGVVISRGGGGAKLLRLSGLSARDALGRSLPSRFVTHGRAISILVRDAGARYPITVDPTVQPIELVPSGGDGINAYGTSVAISRDGNTALVGAPNDNPGPDDAGSPDGPGIGAVWVFTRSGSAWSQQGPKLTAGDEVGNGQFGASVALSDNGNTAFIGGPGDNSVAGAFWVFTRTGSTWTQSGAKHTMAGAGNFGSIVALSGGDTTAMVGGDSNSTGIAVVWPYARSGSNWSQQGPGISTTTYASVGVLEGIALSDDGNTALIGDPGAGGAAGRVLAYARSASTWAQTAQIIPDDESGDGEFGYSVALSADATTALIGGALDGVQAGPPLGPGAAWVFTRSGSDWTQQGAKLTPSDGTSSEESFGAAVALSSTGNTAVIAGPGDFYSQCDCGSAWVFTRSGSTWSQRGSKIQTFDSTGSLFGSPLGLSGDGTMAVFGEPTAYPDGRAWVYPVDTTPPAPFSLVSPAAGATNLSKEPQFLWDTTTDSGSGIDHYELWIDGSLKQKLSASLFCPGSTCTDEPPTPLAGGAHTWMVKAVDGVGNVRSSTTRSFTVDATPPAAFSNASPANGSWVGTTTPTLTWHASSDSGSGLAGYRVLIDGTQSGPDLPPSQTSYTPPSALSPGAHTWKVQAFDGVGNVRQASQWSFKVDTLPPTAAITVDNANPVTGQTVTFDAAQSTDHSGDPIVGYSWDPVGSGAFTSSGTIRTFKHAYPATGTYQASVRVTDAAGKTDTATVKVTVHPAPPPGPVGVSINGGKLYTNNQNVTLDIVWPAGTDTATVANDGGFQHADTFPVAAKISWTLSTAGSQQSPKTVYVRFGSSTQNYTDDILLDTVAPTVTAATSEMTAVDTYKVSVTASDDNSGLGKMQITADPAHPGAARPYAATTTYTGSSAPKWVHVWDNAGNLSKWHAIVPSPPSRHHSAFELEHPVDHRP
jgi:PKD domain/FG-GAP repeat